MDTKKRIKIGMIGMGANGEAHLRNFIKHPYAEVVAICETNKKRLKEISEKYNIARTFTDMSIINQKDIDAITIHTPENLHRAPFVTALRASKNIFMEKPMTDSEEDLRTMVAEARKSDGKVLVGFILRFDPLFREVKTLVDDGKLGKIFYMEADYIHNLIEEYDLSPYRSHTATNWQEFMHAMPNDGVHAIDLLRFITDDEPIKVMSYANRISLPDAKYEATVVSIFKFASGCIGKVTVLYAPVGPRPTAFNLSLYGTEGTVVRDQVCLERCGKFEKFKEKYQEGHPFKPEDNHFIECLVKGKKMLTDTVDGAKSEIAGIYADKAIREGKPVKIPQV